MEWLVDVHAFTPGDLSSLAERAGFESVQVRGEELTANWFGWVSRTLEGSAEPDEVPMAWRWYAYGGYRALRALDRTLLEPRLPPAIFYNLLLSARAPAIDAGRPMPHIEVEVDTRGLGAGGYPAAR